jgi:hypothetical protein
LNSTLTVLDKLGYVPLLSKAECIFSDSVKKSFESLFGKDATPIILNNLSSLYGLSEKELTTNYDIFAKSLYKLSGYGAKIILAHIKQEMLIRAVTSSLASEITEKEIANPNIGVEYILKKISYSEVIEFVHRMLSGMHVIFVYENENAKHKILDAFLEGSYSGSNHSNTNTVSNSDGTMTSTVKALISNKKTEFSHINNILYYEDLTRIEKSEILNKILDWINSFKNKSNYEFPEKRNKEDTTDKTIISPEIRLAIEDMLCFLSNILGFEFASVEEMLKKHTNSSKPTSILCIYKMSKIFGSDDASTDEEMITRIVKSHSCLILEDPPIIYGATRPLSDRDK